MNYEAIYEKHKLFQKIENILIIKFLQQNLMTPQF